MPANRYSRWAPTEYVGLPIDSYQASAFLQEQRTEESMQRIQGVIDSYAAIQPISKDPQALYDQTINKIKEGSAALVNQNLKTPMAKRAITQLINDPSTVSNLEKVYMDSVYAAKARTDMEEYLKKNPEVNAVDYLVAFNRLGQETGDASNFDPNRFKNMGPLSDYVDVRKRMEEGISKLQADSQEQKKIFGDKYIELKEKGLLEGKIREYVRGTIMSDPSIQGQLNRNLKYQYYQSNPYDLDAGKSNVASFYRTQLQNSRNAIVSRLGSMAEGKSKKELEADKSYHKAVNSAAEIVREYDELLSDDVDDDVLVSKLFQDGFTKSFDPFTWRETKQGEEWTPMAVAQMHENQAWARMKWKQQQKEKMITDALNAPVLTMPGLREQVDETPEKWGAYIRKQIPELSGINIDKNGFLTSDYKNVFRKVGNKYYAAQDLLVKTGNKYYSNGQEVSGDDLEKNYTLAKDNGSAGSVYIRKGAAGRDKAPDKTQNQSLYNADVDRIRQYLDKYNIANQYDLTKPAEVQNALRDIVRFSQSFESSYSPIYTFPAGETKSFRNQVASLLPNVKVTTSEGKTVTGTELSELQNLLRSAAKDNADGRGGSNITIGIQPVNMKGESQYVISSGGKSYYVPVHNEFATQLSPLNQMMQRFYKNHHDPTGYGDDLVFSGMEKGGIAFGGVIKGGNTVVYQDAAKGVYEDLVSQLSKIGVKTSTARKKLNEIYSAAIEYNQKHQNDPNAEPYSIVTDGGKVYIPTPVYSKAGKYYTEASIVPNMSVQSIGDYTRSYMNEFSSARNPYMVQPLFERLGNKNLFNILSAGDDDE